ncbi:MAG: AAA family ATPase [Clostridium sp.]
MYHHRGAEQKETEKIQNCEIGGTHHENNRNYEPEEGGISKTMTAASIAYLLGEEQGKKVLLVDADQQGNVSMLYDRYKPEGIGMSELLERHRSVGDLTRQQIDPDNTVSQC